jgi:SAM-dependent methyltransferase
MSRPQWASDDIDIDRPNAARVYDYLLGGSHNFAVDRALGDQVIAASPTTREQAGLNRAFLGRAVRFCADRGIRQFLDLGSGIPTAGNVHEVARAVVPDARVVYVDIDPIAIAHGRDILADDPHSHMLGRDLRDADEVLADIDDGKLLDLGEPVALLMVAVLHAVPDADDPAGIIGRYTNAVPTGSFLAISHGTDEGNPVEARRVIALSQRTNTPLSVRSKSEIETFFHGYELAPPGVTWLPAWHRDTSKDTTPPEDSNNYAGVGCRR